MVNISEMIDPQIQNPGVKKAYEYLAPRLIIQKLARLRNQKGISSSTASELLKQELGKLEKKDGKKSKGEQIFGPMWEKLKEKLENEDWEGLAKFPLTDTERQYLFGMFKTASRIASIAHNIVASDMRFKRIVGRVVMGWINTIDFKVKDTLLRYQTDGYIVLMFTDKEDEFLMF